PLQAVLQRGVERGEIDPAADLEVVHDLLIAPLMYRWVVTDAPIDANVIRQIIATVTAGAALPSGA
ncbi:MAG: TetR-like C-terminal domain-containing protein, partial [Ilumatobacteraceae bacterium]